MRSKVTVVLLFLNVVLFFFIFQYERTWRAENEQGVARRRVLGAEAAGITAFTRTHRAAPTLSAEKRDSSWWITQPFEWPANPNAVSRVMNELQFLEHETSFSVADLGKTGQTLADYGLADPAIVFTFTSGGREYSIKLGDDTRIGNRLYLLSANNERIHVVNRSVADTLGLSTEALRSESIFTIPVFEVRSLAILRPAPAELSVRLRRDGQRWVLETPIFARASKSAVEVAIAALNGLRARTFLELHSVDPARTGLANPQLRITLEGISGREILLVGNDAGDGTFYAKLDNRNSIFTVGISDFLLKTLRSAQEELRDKRILDFDVANVTGFTIAAPGQPELTFARDPAAATGDAWQMIVRGTGTTPETMAADPDAVVQGFLQRLQVLEATKFVNDAPSAAFLEEHGFNRPERTITLSLSTGGGPRQSDPTTITLEIGTAADSRSATFARLQNPEYVYAIPPEFLEDAPSTVLDFRHRLLRELPEGARITSLKLTNVETDAVVFETTATNNAALTAENVLPAGASAEKRSAATVLLGQMQALRAKRFVSASFNPAGAPYNGSTAAWRYRLDLTIALTGGENETQTPPPLMLTERLGGTTQLAGTEDFGGVTFEVPAELLDAVFALTYTPPPAPAESTGPSK